MGRLYLCQVKRAEEPFVAPETDVPIWTIEELCYYADNHLALMDATFFAKPLTDWLARELQLLGLAKRLTLLQQSEAGALPQLVLLNAETGWLYIDSAEALEAQLAQFAALPQAEQMAARADDLASHGKIMRAMKRYQEILKREDVSEDDAFAGRMWHNLGVLYARLFQYEEAQHSLERAHEKLHTAASLADYLTVIWLGKGQAAFDERAAQLGVDEGTKKDIAERIGGVLPPALPAKEERAGAVDAWVDAYRRATQG